MADSAALRARRARRHKNGDHSLCDPARRCEAAAQQELAEAVAGGVGEQAASRGPRGEALWKAMAEEDLGPMQRVLLDQLCRCVDRLDRLEAVLEKKSTWLRFDRADDPGEIVVIVDAALAEVRQQETTAKALVAEIRAALPKATGKPGAPPAPTKGGLSDLTARIQRRQAAAR